MKYESLRGKKTRIFVLLVLIISIGVLFLSCGSDITGKYVSEDRTGFVEFKKDNTLITGETGGFAYSGTYKQDGKKLILTFNIMGTAVSTPATIDGDKIIDEDGQVFIKEK